MSLITCSIPFASRFSRRCIKGALGLSVAAALPVYGQTNAFPADGNVGVGTTSPGAKLVVQGASAEAWVQGDSTRTLALGNWDGTWQYVKSINLGAALTPLQLQASVFSLTGGNVGVGTTTPNYKLDVDGNIHATAGIISSSTGLAGLFSGYGGGLDGSTYQQFDIYADASNGLTFEAPKDAGGNRLNIQFNWRGGGTSPLFIQGATSNIGIGTSNPHAKLDVVGTIIADSASSRPITLGGNVGSILLQGDTGGWAFGLHAKGSGGTSRGGFGFAGGDDLLSYYYIGDSYANPTAVVRPGNGSVGIGTVTPGAKLDVKTPTNDGGVGIQYTNWNNVVNAAIGASSVTGAGYFAIFDNNASRKVNIDAAGSSYFNGGRVGIATTSPSTSFQVATDDIVSGGITVGSGLSVDGGNLRLLSSTNHWNLDNNSGSLRFFTETGYGIGGAVRMTLSAAGDLGVTGNLTVNGTFSAPSYTASNGTVTGGSTGLIVNAGGTNQNVTIAPSGTGATILNGNVGIGTASPQTNLEVSSIGNTNTSLRLDRQSAGNAAQLIFSQGATNRWGIIDRDAGALSAPQTRRLDIYDFATGAPRLSIDHVGNVGIGTTSPQRALHVAATGSVFTLESNTATADNRKWDWDFGGGNTLNLRAVDDAYSTASIYQSVARSGISISAVTFPNGNVGVGTSAPSSRLEVNGDISLTNNFNSIHFLSAAGPGDMYLDVEPGTRTLRTRNWNIGSPNIAATSIHTGNVLADGNVGIGTINPTTKLEVVGDAKVNGNLTVSGTFAAAVYAATNGVVTGGSTGLALAAGGANQNVTISPSGSGNTIINGNVGLGTTAPRDTFEVKSAGTGGATFVASTNANNIFAGGHAAAFYSTAMTGGLGISVGSNNTSLIQSFKTSSLNGIGATSEDGVLLLNPSGGNVGIGTTSPGTYKLAVNGTIHAKEVVVDQIGWADYVFDDNYRNAPLSEVEQHIKEHKHLPGVPSAADVAEKGVSVGQMQTVLLQKVEELTLHLIRMEKENAELRQRVQQLEATTK